MTSVVIVKRQTLDWAAMDFPEFEQESKLFCRNWGMPENFAFRLAKLWDQTFSHGYFETRAKLKAIAEQNLAALSDVSISPWSLDRDIPHLDAPYVFIDDDDWFSPELPQVLNLVAADKADVVLWRATNIGSPKQPRPVHYWGMNGRCMTHNYAVSRNWLDHHDMDDMLYHGRAMDTIHAMNDVSHLDVCLSVSNKGPISSVSLHRGLQGDFDPLKLAALIDGYVARMDTIEMKDLAHIVWAKPYIDQTIEVYHQVQASLRS